MLIIHTSNVFRKRNLFYSLKLIMNFSTTPKRTNCIKFKPKANLFWNIEPSRFPDGLDQIITKLSFCRHCLRERFGFCVFHEVGSHFCYNCLENIPSGEAKLKKYRCNKCFECPSCQHTLPFRATTVHVPRTEGNAKDAKVAKTVITTSPATTSQPTKTEKAPKTLTQKMYYLSCLACRWTSRDGGLND